MNLKQLLEQDTQKEQLPQQAQKAQDVLSIDTMAVKIDAEKYLSLKVQATEAIESNIDPENLLMLIIGALFGDESPQAATVASMIDAEKHPGGHEMAIAGLRQHKRLLKQQQRQHEEQIKLLSAEIEAANSAERALIAEHGEAATLNRGLIEIAAFCNSLPGTTPEPGTVAKAKELFTRHKESPVAMGLLYGGLAEFARKAYTAGGFDLIQMQQLADLRAQILAAIQ